MAQIVFINGAFGAGKTQSAFELHRRLPGSFVFDLEEQGFCIRKCLPPEMRSANFQDHPEWRGFNNILLRRMTEYSGIVLVPMTLIRPDYYREITDGIEVWRHIVINLSPAELKKRQWSRFDGKKSFAAKMACECIAAFKRFPNELPEAVLLDCDKFTVEETAEMIAAECGFVLLPRENAVKRTLHHLSTSISHMR